MCIIQQRTLYMAQLVYTKSVQVRVKCGCGCGAGENGSAGENVKKSYLNIQRHTEKMSYFLGKKIKI